jgi:phospholipid/cholesterol/gamma-HCH transport system substrate-binding protein
VSNSVAEAAIGAVVVAVAAGFVIYAGQSSGIQVARATYPLTAKFRSAEGIAIGTDVRLAGIKIGTVTDLALDPVSFQATVSFTVDNSLQIPEDSDVKIASDGILGGAFVEIAPGASEFMLAAGDELVNTQSSVDLLSLLMKFGTRE